MTPQPWARTGPGIAKDGRPKFDLELFNQAYFDRLRDRVGAAGNAGIYVAIMLFDGWALHLSPLPDNVEGHPFHAENNVNGIGITSIVDYQVLPLDPRVEALQEAYIRKVIDTVHDLPNVLYEVANESSGGGSVDREFSEALGLGDPPDWGDSTEWQYWVIDVVKRYETKRGYDTHPIGMTMQFPVADQTRSTPHCSAAGPIGSRRATTTRSSPVAATRRRPAARLPVGTTIRPLAGGRKVVISDTDHYAPGQGDALWAWKSFLRGHHPILMDYGIIDGVDQAPPSPAYDAFEPARLAMGDTLRYAERMDLIAMQPRGDLSPTGYVLANPGEEYLVLDPGQKPDAAAGTFTVTLEAGEYAVEWYSVTTRETGEAANLVVGERRQRRLHGAVRRGGTRGPVPEADRTPVRGHR